jgi:hypothetical protein
MAVALDTKKQVAISLKGSPQNGASHSEVEVFRGRTALVEQRRVLLVRAVGYPEAPA